jgi:tRNA(fMet)-specific endonuclease VapC
LRIAANKLILMTGNKFILDTNIVTAWLKGEEAIADKIDRAVGIYIPVTVIGELYYGAMYSARVQKNISSIQRLLANYNVLLIDDVVAFAYGKIKSDLRKKGKPIPENDIWIAAIAFANKIAIVTRDKHFKEIEGLSIKSW